MPALAGPNSVPVVEVCEGGAGWLVAAVLGVVAAALGVVAAALGVVAAALGVVAAGALVVGGGVASGSVYWLSPADGLESASALAGACTATAASNVRTVLVTRRERTVGVSQPPGAGRRRVLRETQSTLPATPPKPGEFILQDLLQRRIA